MDIKSATKITQKMCRVAVPDLRRYIQQTMTQHGMPQTHASKLAQLLINADQRGHYSHGLNRIVMYNREVITGAIIKEDLKPEILKETPAIAYLDGKNMLGVVSAEYAMETCIKKAEKLGIGMVSLRNANHFGIAGHYGLMAVEKGLIGMAFTNTSPLVVPTRSRDLAIGTNPISFFASKDDFQLDMATSTVALGKIEMKRRLNEPAPAGWGVNQKGEVDTDPFEITGLLGLGGAEITGGYKGYGLGGMVEILCGVLSGADFSKNVRKWVDVFEKDVCEKANLGQCFICINPKFFSDDYEKSLKEYSAMLRECQPAEGEENVIIPGDRAKLHLEESLESIEYSSGVIDQIHDAIPGVEKMTKLE